MASCTTFVISPCQVLGGEGHLASSNILWEGFKASWPLVGELPQNFSTLVGSKFAGAKEAMGAGGIPAINTAILLTSGLTLTWAHWGLKKENNTQLVIGLALTVALGLTFVAFQAWEYIHAYKEMGPDAESWHLWINVLYAHRLSRLTRDYRLHYADRYVEFVRSKHHFNAHQHFAFEATAWYWHFVDVVWLGLYLFVYWL